MNSLKHLHEKIIISGSEDSGDIVFEDFQTIDAEIIDYGISEDECEQTSPISQLQLELPTRTSLAGSSADIVHKTKCLCAKSIDCDKHPWYSAKCKEQILTRKHGNTKTNILTNDREVDLSESTSHVSSNKCNINPVINKTKGNILKQEPCKTGLTIPEISGTINNINGANNKKNKSYKQNSKIKNTLNKDKIVNSEELKNIHHQEPIEIDYKNNKGLVGMKIQTKKLEDKLKDKRTSKIIPQRNEEGSTMKKNNRNNNVYNEENKTGNMGSMTIPNFQTTLKKVEIERDQIEQHFSTSDFTKDRFKEKHGSLKCSLKIPPETVLEVMNKRRKIKCDVGEKEDDDHILIHKKNTSKSVDICTDPKQNQETELSIAVSGSSYDGNFDKLCNKISVDQHTNVVRRKPMPKSKRIEMDNLETERQNICGNNNKNIDQQIEKNKLTSSDVAVNNANENIKRQSKTCFPAKNGLRVLTKQFLNKEKVFTVIESTPKLHSNTSFTNRSTFMSDISSSVSTKSLCVDQEVPNKKFHFTDNYGMYKHTDNTQKTNEPVGQCKMSSSDLNSIVSTQLRKVRKPNSPAKFSTIAKDGVFITTNAASPASQINESQIASEPHSLMKSRRKQPVNIRCINNIDNIDNYVQTIRNIEKYMNSNLNTQSESRSNFKPFYSLPIESSKPQQYHIPQDPILSGRKLNPNIYITKEYNMPDIISTINTLTPHYMQTPAICNRTSMETMPTTANFKHILVNGLNFRANVLRTQTALQPFSTLSHGTRNQSHKKQLNPGTNMQIRVPNQVYPIHGRPQEMPTENVYMTTNLGRAHKNQNNHMQRPEIIPNFANISQIMLGYPSRPPGICDVQPLNIRGPETNNLRPRPPPPTYEASIDSFVASSIIGRNNDGVV